MGTKIAVVTGATSGIGKAFAQSFASQGYDLLITGRRKEVIHGVAEEIRSEYGVNVEVILADLSNREDLSHLLDTIGSKNNVAVLVNNAGYGNHVWFSEDTIEHHLAMANALVNAPLMLIHKVLPRMMEQKEGIIINVSSIAAYFPVPGSAMYTGTKSFLKGFTESLHLEVRRHGIQVQCLCPGFTYSDFHRNEMNFKKDRVPWMNPSEVVEYSIRCLKKGKVVCVPGVLNRSLVVMGFLIPRNLYYRLVTKQENKFMQKNEATRFEPVQ